MEIIQINKETVAFDFDEIEGFSTAVFLIDKPNRYYLIDTYCGATPMGAILQYIENRGVKKRMVVINTHHHWDHIWGNCLFENRTLIAHNSCYTMMETYYEDQVKRNAQYIMGDNEMTLPNLTFQNKLFFQDDDIEVFYSPGHTLDCISIYDSKNRTLFVGDNLEKPLIYVEDPDIRRYIYTLTGYLDYLPEKIVGSHSLDLSIEDLEEAIEYLRALDGKKYVSFDIPAKQLVHEANLKTLEEG